MKKHQTPCIFCDIITGQLPATEVYRDEHCIVIMDIFPITKGHLLVVPLKHHARVENLPYRTQSHLMQLSADLSRAICESSLNADATNLIINNGKAANQHIPHVHLHVLPRYRFDTFSVILRSLLKPLVMLLPFTPSHRIEAHADSIRLQLSRFHSSNAYNYKRKK